MTTICLLQSGVNVAGAVRVRGDVVSVGDDTAELLCSTGAAERVVTQPVEVREIRPAEVATPRSTGGRRRSIEIR